MQHLKFKPNIDKKYKIFLEQYGLTKKIIVYVKNEGFNMNITTVAFKFVIRCDTLAMEESFQRTCFEHAFF